MDALSTFLANKTVEEAVEALKCDPLNIQVSKHKELPLVILNYHQCKTKHTPLTSLCRQRILRTDTWEPVARSFVRFYESDQKRAEPLMSLAGEWDFYVKHDGSLMMLWYNPFTEQWSVASRSTFGTGRVMSSVDGKEEETTWEELFWSTLGIDRDLFVTYLDPSYSYVWELCTTSNRVVERHDRNQCFLLASFCTKNGTEQTQEELDLFAAKIGVSRALRLFRSDRIDLTEVHRELAAHQEINPWIEGVVAYHWNGETYDRVKIKTHLYLQLHHARRLANQKFELTDGLLHELSLLTAESRYKLLADEDVWQEPWTSARIEEQIKKIRQFGQDRMDFVKTHVEQVLACRSPKDVHLYCVESGLSNADAKGAFGVYRSGGDPEQIGKWAMVSLHWTDLKEDQQGFLTSHWERV